MFPTAIADSLCANKIPRDTHMPMSRYERPPHLFFFLFIYNFHKTKQRLLVKVLSFQKIKTL